jgi:hypothetical protein
VSNLDRRPGYTPRRVREQRAYRMVVVGGASGTIGAVLLVLSIVGIGSAALAIVLLIVAAACAYGFMRQTGKR